MTGPPAAIRPYLGRLTLAAVAGVAAELCGLGLVAAAAWLIARAAQRPPLAALSPAIVAVRGFAIFKGVLRYGERLAGHDAALRVLAELRGRVFDALAARRGPTRDGDALVRLVADVEAVQDLLLRCLLPATAAVLAGAAATVLVTVVSPVAGGVLAAGLLLAGIAVPAVAWAAAHRTGAAVSAQRARLAVRSLDVLEGAADLAAYGATGSAIGRAAACARRLARLERTAAAVSGAAAAAGSILQVGTAAAVLLVAVRSGAGGVTVTLLTLTCLVAVETVLPLTGAAQRLAEAGPAARRVSALPAAPPPAGPVRRRTLASGPPVIELLGVRAAYEGRVALDGVDLRIGRGRRVVIVGASGAGKSTLLAVLSGEVAAVSGAVVLDGHDLAAYDPGDVRAAVRGLAQDAHVFGTTLRANLLLARPLATGEELEAAARRARLLEVVRELPDGWDTPVGSGGRGLSGGQHRRLLLARALLADPAVLVLDEPGEGLDVPTADDITRELLTAPGGGTLVMVTHRLAGLDLADEIVVLDRGRVVQRGAHRDLLGRRGPYRDLWEAERLTGTPA
ncbi:thiol reductant ABC exporter subunit CydC [Actinomadura scrupuli]|uniref:thiol reductant ABC exporter subunit CydC n=1 Tax=Actinomadura scrupuli TaxID=559629 RepID=UPI003D99AC62